ncbi:MAG: AraC family transcriptional regulator [Ekhidna sp.]
MKVLPFKIPKAGDPAILTQIDSGAYFYDILHKHPEYQITLIVRGHGTLICDEYLGRFTPGNVLMFGPNQPHVLKCDEEFYKNDKDKDVYAISIFFSTDALGRDFLRLEEAQDLRIFLEEGKYGFKFSQEISDKLRLPMEQIPSTNNLALIIEFLSILKYLMMDDFAEKLSYNQRSMSENQGQRMNAVMQYTLNHYREHITIDEIASIANMTPNAFCKYFKARTRKTYLSYVNELRVSYACGQFSRGNPLVSLVANQSGFQNLSHFNRCFKRIVGTTPGKYGRLMNRS